MSVVIHCTLQFIVAWHSKSVCLSLLKCFVNLSLGFDTLKLILRLSLLLC